MGTMSAASMNSISWVQGQKRSMERGNWASAKPNPTKATSSNRFQCFPLPAYFIQERLVLLQDGENGGTLLALQYTNISQHCDPAGEKRRNKPKQAKWLCSLFSAWSELKAQAGVKGQSSRSLRWWQNFHFHCSWKSCTDSTVILIGQILRRRVGWYRSLSAK